MKPQTCIPHTDGKQKFLLALSLFDLIFFCYYLFRFEIARQSTISDTLFAMQEYRVVLTVLLALRLTGGWMFLYRFRDKHHLWEMAGYLGLILALVGW